MLSILPHKDSLVKASTRILAIGSGLMLALLILLGTAPTANAAPDRVTIINLTGENIHVATAHFYKGLNNGPSSMIFNNWYSIEPGKSSAFANSSFYVEQGRERISWSNKKEWSGIVRHGAVVDNLKIVTGTYGVLDSGTYSRNLTQFLNSNPSYEKVTFQDLSSGQYTVSRSNPKYEIKKATFPFDRSSRERQVHLDCYPVSGVSGTVVDYSYSYSYKSWNPSTPTWTQETRRVCYGVGIEGYQPYIGAARVAGYFRGTLTVFYTVPLPSSSNNTNTTSSNGTLPKNTYTGSSAPVLESVNVINDRMAGPGFEIVWQDFRYRDADGDAEKIHLELVRTTASNVNVRDKTITVPAEQQKLGVTDRSSWTCNTGNYDVTLRATVIDRAGNKSNAREYTMHCGDTSTSNPPSNSPVQNPDSTAQGGSNRARVWIECDADGEARIHVHTDPWEWPYPPPYEEKAGVWISSGGSGLGEGPMQTWDIQPKYVAPHKKGVNSVDYRITVRFVDAHQEIHNVQYRWPSGCNPTQPQTQAQPPAPSESSSSTQPPPSDSTVQNPPDNGSSTQPPPSDSTVQNPPDNGSSTQPPPSNSSVNAECPYDVCVVEIAVSDAPKRRQNVTFTATFVNKAPEPRYYDWLILLFDPNKNGPNKGFGESPHNQITVPPGTSTVSVTFLAVNGPGPCMNLYAQAGIHKSATEKPAFPGSDGQPLSKYFDVCP